MLPGWGGWTSFGTFWQPTPPPLLHWMGAGARPCTLQPWLDTALQWTCCCRWQHQKQSRQRKCSRRRHGRQL
jgi:hypothetical protein